MPVVSLAEWNQFLQKYPNVHLLQTGEWGELKSAFGWKPVRAVSGEMGIQILFRKLPLGFTIGYIPKPVMSAGLLRMDHAFWQEVDSICRQNRAIFLKLEPDLWQDESSSSITNDASLRIAPQNIQPPRT